MSKRVNRYYGGDGVPIIYKNYINYLHIVAFLILYIIVFVYLFKDEFQVTALIILTIFHLFFCIFVAQLIATNVPTSWMALSIWFSISLGVLLKLISLITMVLTFKAFDDKFISKNIKVDFLKEIKKDLNDYKILFITSISLIILFITSSFFINFNDNSYNSIISFSFLFATMINVVIIAITSQEVKLSNQFVAYETKYIHDFDVDAAAAATKPK